jgi:hypothetical protein
MNSHVAEKSPYWFTFLVCYFSAFFRALEENWGPRIAQNKAIWIRLQDTSTSAYQVYAGRRDAVDGAKTSKVGGVFSSCTLILSEIG